MCKKIENSKHIVTPEDVAKATGQDVEEVKESWHKITRKMMEVGNSNEDSS